MSARVRGYCPMGCGGTLFLGSGGYVTCSLDKCPNPTAVSDILGNRETEHIVKLNARDFSVQHPIRERLDGYLHDCDLHTRISRMDGGPPAKPGIYRVRSGARLHWELITAIEVPS